MNVLNFKNKLIVFEGEDHSGKSTIAKMLTEYLNQSGVETIYTFQPGDLRYGDYASFINKLCKSKEFNLDTLSNLFAFLFDRAEATSKIVLPALKAGKTVVSDRWWYSTFAYQFYGKQLKERFDLTDDFIAKLNLFASHYLEPDITFYFARPEALVKSTEDNKMDLFEMESDLFKKRVKEAYLTLVKKYNFKIIEVDENASVTLEKVLNES